MRFLNKIIFINSAHIPYAEVKLDGNVHFIGTQGVGKSTLLRAILFFYNVDKSKLGIRTQDKQKGYDEFYLPYPNSYIVYEVCRENGNFMVVTFLSAGRTAFRIVDCSYDRRFFIDEDGNARYEWGKISEQIGAKVFKSNIIRRYEEFRDIIYGNTQNISKELRRFNIMESTKYLNVSRTIQNIFLNQSLESRVIKDTIIDSMNFSGDGIDLNIYREHVKDFHQQYTDIWKWFKVEKSGKIKVRVDADNVITSYSLFESSRKTISRLCGNLNFAMERDSSNLPLIEKKISEQRDELARQQRLLSEEESKYNNERDHLRDEDALARNFLKQIQEKRQKYAAIGIENIIARIAKENELKTLQQSLDIQQAALTDKNRDVTAKYKLLKDDIDSRYAQMKNQCDGSINMLDKELTEAIAAMSEDHSAKQEALQSDFMHQSESLTEKIDSFVQEKNELKLNIQKVSTLNPFSEDADVINNQISAYNEKKSRLSNDRLIKQQEQNEIIAKTEASRKDIEYQCEKDIASVQAKIAKANDDIQKLDELLSRQQGSLIEWLSNNVENWDTNIGKILDEDLVLYNAELNPQRVDDSETVFGIKIDVENIERTIKTPEEIKSQKARLEQIVKQYNAEIADLQAKRDADIEKLVRKPNAQIKELKKQIIDIEAELNQIPQIINKLAQQLQDIDAKLSEWRETQLSVLRQQMESIEVKIDDLRAKKQQLGTNYQKGKDSLTKAFEKSKKDVSSKIALNKQQLIDDLLKLSNETTEQKKRLEIQMDAELHGLGVDVSKMQDLRKQLESVVAELNYIENHRVDYIRWQSDEKEYFAFETSKKEVRKDIKRKLDELQAKFNDRKVRLEDKVRTLSRQVDDLTTEQKRLTEAIAKVSNFINSSICPAELSTTEPQKVIDELSDILDALRDAISNKQRLMEEFKNAVNTFKNNFSAQNTFKFRTEFNSDADFIEFAAELNDFISNNKIEEYKMRTSSQYAKIFKQIAKEVSELDQHNADIKATINDINKDFRDNNFVGVIKGIELRAVESSDRLMQQLLNIKHFDDEHVYDIGQLNLFSDEKNVAETNRRAVDLLMAFIGQLEVDRKREYLTLSDTFKLEFKVKENDNDTNWVEKLSNVGSEGTDILVKSMINIMLINVFKHRISRKFGDYKLHCMMDEIGKLHPNNIEGILKFANERNIYLINSSPTTYNAQAYKYTYALEKDSLNNTVVKTILTVR